MFKGWSRDHRYLQLEWPLHVALIATYLVIRIRVSLLQHQKAAANSQQGTQTGIDQLRRHRSYHIISDTIPTIPNEFMDINYFLPTIMQTKIHRIRERFSYNIMPCNNAVQSMHAFCYAITQSRFSFFNTTQPLFKNLSPTCCYKKALLF